MMAWREGESPPSDSDLWCWNGERERENGAGVVLWCEACGGDDREGNIRKGNMVLVLILSYLNCYAVMLIFLWCCVICVCVCVYELCVSNYINTLHIHTIHTYISYIHSYIHII